MIYFLVTGEAFPQYKHLLIEINPKRFMPTIAVLEKWKDDLKMLMLHYVLNITKYTSDELEENYYDNTPEWKEWCDNLLYFYCCRYVMDGRQIPISVRKEPEDEEQASNEPNKKDLEVNHNESNEPNKKDVEVNHNESNESNEPNNNDLEVNHNEEKKDVVVEDNNNEEKEDKIVEKKEPSKRGRKPKEQKQDDNVVEKKEPSKRGRKPKEQKQEDVSSEKVPAKRGRKPKSEKIDENNDEKVNDEKVNK